MHLAKRVEDMEGSDTLGRDTSITLMQEYVKEAIPLASTVDVAIEHSTRKILTRVIFSLNNSGDKILSAQHSFEDTGEFYRYTVNKMLYRIQEELDNEPEIHTKPKPGAYAPHVWAKKLAEKAMR